MRCQAVFDPMQQYFDNTQKFSPNWGTTPMPIRTVIYDMDGILLDTEGLYMTATQQVVGQYGKVFDWSLKSQMMGRPKEVSAQILIDHLALPMTAESYLAEREAHLRTLFANVSPIPGAQSVTQFFADVNIPQGVATSSTQAWFDLKTQNHGEWFSVFDHIVTGDDPAIGAGKPAPDIFLLAAQRLNANPAECLVFEDSPSGVTAAKAAGMTVIAVPHPDMDANLVAHADHVLPHFDAFQPEQWGLPTRQ